jgi:hypothetical protein
MRTIYFQLAIASVFGVCGVAGRSQDEGFGSFEDHTIGAYTAHGAPSSSSGDSGSDSNDAATDNGNSYHLPPHVHSTGLLGLGSRASPDDGWKFASRDPNDLSVVPVPDGTPSKKHKHWLWTGDGKYLRPEPGWVKEHPEDTYSFKVVRIKPGTLVPGYPHWVWSYDCIQMDPDPAYERLNPGDPKDTRLVPIVPAAFERDARITDLRKEIDSALQSKAKLQSQLQGIGAVGFNDNIRLLVEANWKQELSYANSRVAAARINIENRVRELNANPALLTSSSGN